ncbi:hypothetical protein [Streptomyces sp. NRRL S-337]|uniref:hypothetical protein n=1 Tax=Streptomyces sp. NRRL S-337 TaxID=1463900 RepID=UPI000A721CE1|nr:hypothetical protein [Streptomyces sp. NRRL S-337]
MAINGSYDRATDHRLHPSALDRAQLPAPRYLDRLVCVDVADTLQDLGGPWWSARRGGAGRTTPLTGIR